MPYYPYTLAMMGYLKEGRQLDREWSGGLGFPPERKPKPEMRAEQKRLPNVQVKIQARARNRGQFRGRGR